MVYQIINETNIPNFKVERRKLIQQLVTYLKQIQMEKKTS